jgi:hypothetical protein
MQYWTVEWGSCWLDWTMDDSTIPFQKSQALCNIWHQKTASSPCINYDWALTCSSWLLFWIKKATPWLMPLITPGSVNTQDPRNWIHWYWVWGTPSILWNQGSDCKYHQPTDQCNPWTHASSSCKPTLIPTEFIGQHPTWSPCTCTVGNEQYLPHHSSGTYHTTLQVTSAQLAFHRDMIMLTS